MQKRDIDFMEAANWNKVIQNRIQLQQYKMHKTLPAAYI